MRIKRVNNFGWKKIKTFFSSHAIRLIIRIPLDLIPFFSTVFNALPLSRSVLSQFLFTVPRFADKAKQFLDPQSIADPYSKRERRETLWPSLPTHSNSILSPSFYFVLFSWPLHSTSIWIGKARRGVMGGTSLPLTLLKPSSQCLTHGISWPKCIYINRAWRVCRCVCARLDAEQSR